MINPCLYKWIYVWFHKMLDHLFWYILPPIVTDFCSSCDKGVSVILIYHTEEVMLQLGINNKKVMVNISWYTCDGYEYYIFYMLCTTSSLTLWSQDSCVVTIVSYEICLLFFSLSFSKTKTFYDGYE